METQRLLSRIEDVMVAAIPAAIENTLLMEPLYAVLIDYFHWTFSPDDLELNTSPPLVIAATVSLRRAIFEAHEYPDCHQWDAGYVDEVEGKVALQLPLDADSHALFTQFFAQVDEDDERPGPMLCRVAARLNNVDWLAITNVTDDFIVCVQDSHGEHDNQADMEACVPPDRIADLQSRGLLWRW